MGEGRSIEWEEVGWMEDLEKNSSVRTEGEKKKEEEEEGSLWSPVCCSCHPLFIPLFLMLQSGVSHSVSPERESKGRNTRERERRRRVIKSHDEGEVGRNKRKSGCDRRETAMLIARLLHGSPFQKLICMNKKRLIMVVRTSKHQIKKSY